MSKKKVLWDDSFRIWSLQGLTPTEKYILKAYGGFANAKTGKAFPSIMTLCKMTGLSRNTIIRLKKKPCIKGCYENHRENQEWCGQSSV